MIRLPANAIGALAGPAARLRGRLQPPPPPNAWLLSRILILADCRHSESAAAGRRFGARRPPRYSFSSLGVAV